jgi:hypothetical protein
MPESPVTTLERWTDRGAAYRVVQLTDELAIVELQTCHGEPVERLESSDPVLLEHLRRVLAAEAAK